MKFINLILLFALATISAKGQHESHKLISYYASTSDYANSTSSEKKVIPKNIILQTEKLIRIPMLIDQHTEKRSKEAGFPWAISIDSTVYFNLRYSIEMQSPEMYIKPDITGRFCVLFADKETLRTIAANGSYYGGGLQGVLMNESTKWGKNWVSEDGEEIKIFIVDVENLELNHIKGYRNAAWKILSKNNLNEILEQNLTKEEIKELSIDDIKDKIQKINNAS